MSRSRRHSVFSALIALGALVPCLSGCGGPSGGNAAGGSGAGRTGSATSRQAPDFALKDIHGKDVRLADYSGKVRLVDFWATWCAPCREEIPAFKDLQARYGGDGFVILAISMDDCGAGCVKPFVEKHQIPYPNLIGNDEVVAAFGDVVGYPTAYLIDRDGKIVAKFLGGTPKRVFENMIRETLGLEKAS